jgi:hypothetical protein
MRVHVLVTKSKAILIGSFAYDNYPTDPDNHVDCTIVMQPELAEEVLGQLRAALDEVRGK